jgi:multidrug efflux pump subunit AcrB
MEPLLRLIDRKLQETTGLDFISSYTSAGVTTIFVNLKGSTTRSEVPEIWRRVRKNWLPKSLGV